MFDQSLELLWALNVFYHYHHNPVCDEEEEDYNFDDLKDFQNFMIIVLCLWKTNICKKEVENHSSRKKQVWKLMF